MQTNIRKWGNSTGAIIPAGALAQAGFSLGDAVEIDVEDGRITLKPMAPKYSLDDLLKATPAEAVALDDEDLAWLHDAPVGQEFK